MCWPELSLVCSRKDLSRLMRLARGSIYMDLRVSTCAKSSEWRAGLPGICRCCSPGRSKRCVTVATREAPDSSASHGGDGAADEAWGRQVRAEIDLSAIASNVRPLRGVIGPGLQAKGRG